MALPSGYEYASAVYRNLTSAATSSPYFDLGIVPSNTTNISLLMRCTGDYKMWVFGARNTNSNTSPGQTNLYYGGQTSATQIGYAGARLSLGNDAFPRANTSFQKDENVFTINNGNRTIKELTGATTAFTGTRNMFLFALNNAGTPLFGEAASLVVYCVRVYSNGELTHEFVPVYDTANAEQCLYDTVADAVIQKSGSGNWDYYSDHITHYLLELNSDVGGYCYIRTRDDRELTKFYCERASAFSISKDQSSNLMAVEISAYEKNGYAFIGWEKDGAIVSMDKKAYVAVSEATTLTARFKKLDEDDPKNQCYLMCFKYGIATDEDTPAESFAYTPVINAKIAVDGVSKTNSTIEVKEVPDGVTTNSIVVLKNPRGKILYIGVIKSIVDNVLTCREPLSIFDSDFMFGITRTSDVAFMEKIREYLSIFTHGRLTYANDEDEINYSVMRLAENVEIGETYGVSIDNNLNMNITAPVIDSVNVSNLEDYVLKAFDEFGISITADIGRSWYSSDHGQNLQLTVDNPKLQPALTISDNNDAITDVTVDVQDMEYTSLAVYNSSGATFRGMYAVKYDGTITNYNYLPSDRQSFVAHDVCKPKVVMTDDNIKTVVEQYLSNAKYNHKITFNLDLDSDLYSLDALNIGRRVTFYCKNKIYNSIVTGLEWELPTNMEDPHTVKVILGKVRNKLTTKLNLGKVKR